MGGTNAKTADGNVCIGKSTGNDLSTGEHNVLIGQDAGQKLTTASRCIIIGALSGGQGDPTTGPENIFIGYQSGYSTGTGGGNVLIGNYTGYNLSNDESNTFVGHESGRYQWGGPNVFVGRYAGRGTSGSSAQSLHNVAIGYNALEKLEGGDYNTCVGNSAGHKFTTAYRNTCVGYNAGFVNGWQNNAYGIYLGMESYPGAVNSSNEIVIGVDKTGKGSNTGFMNAGDGGNYAGNNSASWSTTSDRRIKKNITDNITGLEALNQIRVRNFEYRTEDEIIDFDNPKSAVVNVKGLQLGVIAQEIEEILPDVVTTLDSGVKTVDPDNLTWYLVNAVKELSAKNDALEARMATLEG
jgi:hypothetical protein